jgi:hypothetical protein
LKILNYIGYTEFTTKIQKYDNRKQKIKDGRAEAKSRPLPLPLFIQPE